MKETLRARFDKEFPIQIMIVNWDKVFSFIESVISEEKLRLLQQINETPEDKWRKLFDNYYTSVFNKMYDTKNI